MAAFKIEEKASRDTKIEYFCVPCWFLYAPLFIPSSFKIEDFNQATNCFSFQKEELQFVALIFDFKKEDLNKPSFLLYAHLLSFQKKRA